MSAFKTQVSNFFSHLLHPTAAWSEKADNITGHNPSNAVPAAVLPNSNVLLKNGNIVDATHVAASAVQSNAASSPVTNLPNGSVKLANANTISPVGGNTPAMPVSVDASKNVVLSNGNTVAPKNIAALPNTPPNPSNTHPAANAAVSAAIAGANSNPAAPTPMATSSAAANAVSGNINAARSGCPIAAPSAATQYCRPAPFSGVGKYFYVNEAYGTPSA